MPIQNVFLPRPAFSASVNVADQRLTVDSTAGGVQFTAYAITDADCVQVDVQAASCYMTIDGSAPTTSNGHLLLQGENFTWGTAYFNAAKFIRSGAVSAVLHASPLKI